MIKLISPQTSFLGRPLALASFLQVCHNQQWWWLSPASACRGSPIGTLARVPALLWYPPSSASRLPLPRVHGAPPADAKTPDSDAVSLHLFAYFILCVFAPPPTFLGHSRQDPEEIVREAVWRPEVCCAQNHPLFYDSGSNSCVLVLVLEIEYFLRIFWLLVSMDLS